MSKHRGRRMWGLLLGPAMLAMGLTLTDAARAEPLERPNVVVIVIDDLGWGDLACYGNQVFLSPNISKIADEGARLTAFYSCVPDGAGSRVALHTGRYPFRTGLVKTPSPAADAKTLGLSPDEITLGEAFAGAGYATALVGKWQLGMEPQFLPRHQGYQQFFGLLNNNDEHPVKLYEGDQVKQALVFQPTLIGKYTDRAVDFISTNQNRPFFLMFSHSMLHKPLAASENFFGHAPGGLYGDVMAELDDSTGRILAKLIELKLDEKTIIIVTSDNGPWFGGSTGGLRGMKGMTWDGGIRIPLVARWPGHIPAGHTSSEIAGLIDLFPTLLAAASIQPPTDREIDGLDIMPMLTGDAPSPHKALYSFVEDKLCTVRSGKWKLHGPLSGPRPIVVMSSFERWVDPKRPDRMRILAPKKQYHPSEFPGVATGFDDPGFALVDLESDPSEQTDLSKTRADDLAEMRVLFDAMLEQLPEAAREASVPTPNPEEGDKPATGAAPSEADKPTESPAPSKGTAPASP